MSYNVRVAYHCRSGKTKSLNIDWENKVYVKDTWDSGWKTYLEAKLARDVENLEAELIRSGFKKDGKAAAEERNFVVDSICADARTVVIKGKYAEDMDWIKEQVERTGKEPNLFDGV